MNRVPIADQRGITSLVRGNRPEPLQLPPHMQPDYELQPNISLNPNRARKYLAIAALAAASVLYGLHELNDRDNQLIDNINQVDTNCPDGSDGTIIVRNASVTLPASAADC